MPSFEDIMNRPSSEIKAPQAYPVGTYHCLVDGPPEAGKMGARQTPYLRFKCKILSPMQDVDAAQAAEQQIVGKIINVDQFITDDAAYRVNEFLGDHLGIADVPGDKSLTQAMAEAPGKQVLVKLRHETSQDGKRVFHRVESTAHV